jgi:hypothetical protein
MEANANEPTMPVRQPGLPASPQPRIGKAILGVLALSAVWMLFSPVYRIRLWIEQPNEGWNAIHVIEAFSRQLYPPPGSLLINNYLPIWFYFVGGLTRLGADPIFAGRIVALIAFLSVACGIFFLLRTLRSTVVAAGLGASCFVLIMCGLLSSYVGLAEPQMLAHALAIWGAIALLSATRPTGIVLAAIVTALALFTKQTVVGLPIASLLWMALYRRQWIWLWTGTLIVAALAGFAGLFLAYGPNFLANMLFPRTLSMAVFGTNIALLSKVVVPLMVFGAVAYRTGDRRDEAIAFAALAIASGIFVIVLFGSAAGVSINIAIDLVVAASIGLGVAWDRPVKLRLSKKQDQRVRVAIALALLLRVAIGAPSPVGRLALDAGARQKLEDISVANLVLRDKLIGLRDPLVCEALSICVWAGHRSDADLWKLHNENTLGPFVDAPAMINRISRGEYGAVILLGDSNPLQDRKLPGLGAALAAGYDTPPHVFSPTAAISLFLPRQAH